MKKLVLITAFAVSLIFSSNIVKAQCTYDVDGNGFIGLNDFIIHLADMGYTVEELLEINPNNVIADHNSNGLIDIMDVVEFVPNLGYGACHEKVEDTTFTCEIVIVEHYVHETEFSDTMNNTIPAGWITYRMYVHMSDPEMDLDGMYGDTLSPMHITSNSNFFKTGIIGNGLPRFQD